MNTTDDLDDLRGYRIIHQSVAGILREKRVVLGMTQKQVAEKAKIPLQSYQRFERGERNLRQCLHELREKEKPKSNATNMYSSEKRGRIFGIACSNTPPLFQF